MKKQMIISILMVSSILLSGSIAAQDIFELIRRNKVEEIKKLIDKDPSVIKVVSKKNNETPLHRAVKQGRKQIVKLLLDKGADVNAKNETGKTPLFLTSDKEVAELLIGKGANVNAKDNDGFRPLHLVEDVGVAELLIKEGANVNARNKFTPTPLTFAIERGIEEVALVLLEKGAKYYGIEPALVETALNVNIPMAEALIKKGFDVNEGEDPWGTPLEVVLSGKGLAGAAEEFSKVLKMLAKKEVINVPDKKGNMPLHYAAQHDDIAFVSILLERGAEINAQDLDGDTPLHLAAKKGLMNIVRFLVTKGADVTITNSEGKTAAQVTKKEDVRNFLLKEEKESIKK